MTRILKIVAFGLLALITVILAIGTVVEKVSGTFAYSSVWMVALWGCMAVASVAYIIMSKLHRRAAVFAIHVSLLVILAGALGTWLTKQEGRIVLHSGETVSQFAGTDGTPVQLPFELSLKQFDVVYYPATNTPADFRSTVTVKKDGASTDYEISMNKPLINSSYRLYQSGYGSDGTATVLSVTYDPIGTPLTYVGYAMLLVSFIAYMFSRATTFRATLARLRRGAVAVAAMLCLALPAHAATSPTALPADLADDFCDMLVFYNGRVCMLHTLARDFTAKISGSTSVEGYTAEQVFTSWMLFPESWNEMPIVKVKDGGVRRKLGIEGRRTSARSFFDEYGRFRLRDEEADASAMQRVHQSGTMEVEEKISLINSLTEGHLLKIFPAQVADGGTVWCGFGDELPETIDLDESFFVRKSMSYFAGLVVTGEYEGARQMIAKMKKYQRSKCGDAVPSEGRLQAENVYNSISQVRVAAIVMILLALAFLVAYCVSAVKGTGQHRMVRIASNVVAVAMSVYITALIALRWYVSGHVPMSNGFETMLFMAWCSFPLAALLRRYSQLLSILAMLMCGLCMMVASISQMNPQISPLVPVLQSPLLCLHVAVIMLAYCLLAFMMLVGVVALVMRYAAKRQEALVQHLALIGQAILIPAVMLLAVGIFIGAVWAGFSWGRYWGWDPKEVWALITLIVYAGALHTRRLSAFTHPVALHAFMVLAFVSVLITYFGVNYLLGGMHSYA